MTEVYKMMLGVLKMDWGNFFSIYHKTRLGPFSYSQLTAVKAKESPEWNSKAWDPSALSLLPPLFSVYAFCTYKWNTPLLLNQIVHMRCGGGWSLKVFNIFHSFQALHWNQIEFWCLLMSKLERVSHFKSTAFYDTDAVHCDLEGAPWWLGEVFLLKKHAPQLYWVGSQKKMSWNMLGEDGWQTSLWDRCERNPLKSPPFSSPSLLFATFPDEWAQLFIPSFLSGRGRQWAKKCQPNEISLFHFPVPASS